MSAEDVEIVRRLYEAITRRDAATVLELYDDDVELDATRGLIGEVEGMSVFHGHDGIREFSRRWYEAWAWSREDVEEVIDLGSHVVVVITTRGRGHTGLDLEWGHTAVATVTNGRVTRMVMLRTMEEALAVVRQQSEP